MKYIDEHGNIVVATPLSNHIPSITLEREIGGTVYTITGSYDGKSTLPSKVVRLILADAKSNPSEE